MAGHTETSGEERRPDSGHKRLQCVVVTPEKTLFDQAVDFVALPMFDGELGVFPGRSPLIGRLGYGELRTKSGDIVHRYYVDGGFAQIRDDVVTLLTNRAVPAGEIDTNAAVLELDHAQEQRALTDDAYATKAKAVERSRALIRVAKSQG
jgi:F-type H+-transporting ATPase subunit epsilon